MRKFRRLYGSCRLAMLTLLLLARAAAAGPPPGSNLEKINALVAEESGKLDEINIRLTTSLETARRLRREVSELRDSASNMQRQYELVASRKAAVESELDSVAKQIKALERRSLRRVRTLYMQSRSSLIEQIAAVGAQSELARNSFYLSKIRSFDRRLLDDLARLRMTHQAKLSELEQLTVNRNQLKHSLAAELKKLRGKLAEEEEASRSLKQQSDAKEDSLLALRAQALRLETVVVSLTGGPAEPASPTIQQPAVHTQTAPFEGRGLAELKGRLLLPVVGKVSRRFGRQKVEGFSDFVSQKGIEYSIEAGAPVSAIAAGRIMYSGSMPGLGRILIVDHGRRYYSLYGRLSVQLATVGSDVAGGQTLGSAGSEGFYFEIRKNGKAVDPQKYYKKEL